MRGEGREREKDRGREIPAPIQQLDEVSWKRFDRVCVLCVCDSILTTKSHRAGPLITELTSPSPSMTSVTDLCVCVCMHEMY